MNPQDEADTQYRAWMADCLTHAADRFELTVTGQPMYGWKDRSIGAYAHGKQGERWLRVVSEAHQWAHGDFWTGNTDANAITGLNKPVVTSVSEWSEGPRRLRAEAMTPLPGRLCSVSDALDHDIDLPNEWWHDLRRALGVIAATPTSRVNADAERVTGRIRDQFGGSAPTQVTRWETVHGDLHWANLLEPRFGLLDWEGWGRGPAGLDAATLYCYSVLTPATAHRVHATFVETLDTEDGKFAQLYACARLLHRASLGDHPKLVAPLRQHAARLLTDLGYPF